MIPPEFPGDESARLAALRRYNILDTPAEAPFDDIVRVAAQICGAPIALVSLFDRDRQWFKAAVGLNKKQIPRETGFCAHAILTPHPFVIPDTAADRRFCDNPLVAAPPKVRFYAGIPLTTSDGHRIGALCVLDTAPRSLTTPQLEAMRVLTHTVMTQLDLRRALQEQQRVDREIRSINETLQRRVHERGAVLEDVLERLKEELKERARRDQSSQEREDRIRRQNQVLVELATRQLANPSNLTWAIEGILEAAARTLGVERASVWLYDEHRTKIRCVDLFERTAGRHSSGIELTAKKYPAYFSALEQERTIAADDARTNGATREFSDSYLVPLGITSMLDAPIRLDGRCVGVVCNEHVGQARTWGDEEQSFAASIADSVSLAMEAGEREAAKREKEQVEGSLRQAQKMETMGRLTGGIAHDFNNLLTVINGYSRLILQQLDAGHPLREPIDCIAEAGDRGAALVRQLLAFSRRQVLQPKTFDPNSMISRMERMLRRLIGEDIRLVTSLAPKLAMVRADPGQIEQVVMNLVVNARDAMPKGGELSVETCTVEGAEIGAGVDRGPWVRISVSDTGFGIDERALPHLFEPFFTTKEPGRGTGLGLATSYGIIKQSGGHISVGPRAGQGTVAIIYLPAAQASETEPSERHSESTTLAGRETVLVAEDDASVRALMCTILKGEGYTVIGMGDGAEAMAEWDRNSSRVDLLIADAVMPRMSGTDLALRIRERRPGLKVLIVTGYPSPDTAAGPLNDPSTYYLQKPFSPEALLLKVRDLLNAPKGS